MPPVDRRRFLTGLGAVAVAPPASGPALHASRQTAGTTFRSGVASFDPTTDSVLLWTRVEPPEDGSSVSLRWLLAGDEALTDVVASGDLTAGPDSDHCVTVEVGELRAGRHWWFRFELAGTDETSPVGRTRTMPAETGSALRVGVVSCSRFAAGGFAAYRALAEREVDLVVHVGDYIYEDGASDVRTHEPAHRLVDLADYRARYAQHRRDADLQALHARHPMVAVWDDHEIAGNAWRDGAPGHDPSTDGPWIDRVLAASRAHEEWVPGRTGRGGDGRLRAWRSLELGPLGELLVLDTRLWGRDQQASTAEELVAGAETRSLLGADQAAFVSERLERADRPPWVLIANQVMFHPLRVPVPTDVLADRVEAAGFLVVDGEAVNPDQWDGYAGSRDEVRAAMGGAGGVVVLTGDVHSSWAWEGTAIDDSGRAAMVELVAPSVSSEAFGDQLPIPGGLAETALLGVSDDLAFVEVASHGYLLVDVTSERVQGEWWYVDPGDAGSHRFGAARSAPRSAPMTLSEVTEPTQDPTPATPPPEPTADEDLPVGLFATAGAAAAVAVAGALVAVRRRRT